MQRKMPNYKKKTYLNQNLPLYSHSKTLKSFK